MGLTKAELEFYERMPRLLQNLADEVKALREEVKELKETLKERETK